jgi:hypothetical protein
MIGHARSRGLNWTLLQTFILVSPQPALLGFVAIARADLNPEGAGHIGLLVSSVI